jgi:protein-S-isoprenylcysteine O-methyltransferase Ste14
MPRWLAVVGAVPLLVSFQVFHLTFRHNAYLSPAVRLQTERSQVVVSSGPYRWVRHPMYAGFVLFTLATSLLLGSRTGLVGSALLSALVAVRAVLEERVLRAELEGYDDYARRVRYRLVPYLW